VRARIAKLLALAIGAIVVALSIAFAWLQQG
jgi:hypothetical protein